jgi:hypothetical protein
MNGIGRGKRTPSNARPGNPETQPTSGDVGTQYMLLALAVVEIVGFVCLTHVY